MGTYSVGIQQSFEKCDLVWSLLMAKHTQYKQTADMHRRLTMSRQWGVRGRGLGEDQGPATQPLHAVKCLSAVGLSVKVSL